MTDQYMFRGEPVYAMFAAVENSAMLTRSSWVDLLTSKVVIASMVYTQGTEFYTLVRVMFDVDSSGAVTPVAQLDTAVDLRSRNEENTVILFTRIAMLLGVLDILITLFLMVTNCLEETGVKKRMNRFTNEILAAETLYSFVMRLLVIYYGQWLIDMLLGQLSLSYEYDHIMEIFTAPPNYGGHGSGGGGSGGSGHRRMVSSDGELSEDHDTVVGFFTTLDELLTIVEERRFVQNMGYFVFMMFFFQLMVYFNAHPRVAILAQTVKNGIDDVFHFFILFGFMFSVLAYLGHWMFGAQVEGFETFIQAGVRQFEMVVGEFPWDNLNGLNSVMTILFYAYFLVYTLIMFFIIINFLLAIIVEAFGRVKRANEENVIENACLSDICDVVKEQMLAIYQCLPRGLRKGIPFMKNRLDFPTRSRVIRYLRKCEEADEEMRKVWQSNRPHERFNVPLRFDRHSKHGGTLKVFADHFGIDIATAISYISVYMTKVEEGVVMSKIQMENFDVNSRDVAGKVKERTLRLKDLGILSEEAQREQHRRTLMAEKALEAGEAAAGAVDGPQKRPPASMNNTEERQAHEGYLRDIVLMKEKQLKDLKWRITARNEEIDVAAKQHHTLVCIIERQRDGGHGKANSTLSIDNVDFDLDDDE
jgi:hypothetical protein